MAEARPEPTNAAESRISDQANRALNILAKWRVLFAGWQLGTRQKGDPEGDAVRDHREVTIIMRAELSALTGLLIDKGVFTAIEYTEALAKEAALLNEDYARRFPGVEATEFGLKFDVPDAVPAWMENWRP